MCPEIPYIGCLLVQIRRDRISGISSSQPSVGQRLSDIIFREDDFEGDIRHRKQHGIWTKLESNGTGIKTNKHMASECISGAFQRCPSGSGTSCHHPIVLADRMQPGFCSSTYSRFITPSLRYMQVRLPAGCARAANPLKDVSPPPRAYTSRIQC